MKFLIYLPLQGSRIFLKLCPALLTHFSASRARGHSFKGLKPYTGMWHLDEPRAGDLFAEPSAHSSQSSLGERCREMGSRFRKAFQLLNLPVMGNFVIVDLCFRDVPGSGRERLPCCPFSFALIQLCPFNEEISIFWAGFGGDGVVIFKLQHAKKKTDGPGAARSIGS